MPLAGRTEGDKTMHANVSCIACILEKQEKQLRCFHDEKKKSEYIHEVLGVLYENGQDHSCPWLLMKINEIYQKYFECLTDYPAIKHRYNQYMLSKESVIEEKIRSSGDILEACIQYVCAGNYIDFGPTGSIDDSILDRLLAKASEEEVSKDELGSLRADLKRAEQLVYLTDNCGEIVMDKIFIKILRELYPQMQITVILRGQEALNDATQEDAKEVGLSGIVKCIGNGAAIAGTDLSAVSREAEQVIRSGDVIISKGQGNFEGLYGEKLNPYFLFLCKCDLFVRRFGLARYSSVFAREDHIQKGVKPLM